MISINTVIEKTENIFDGKIDELMNDNNKRNKVN